MAYYNTNNETSLTLQKSWNQANKQKKLIHHIFTSLWSDETGVYFAPHQIKDVLNERYDENYPLTSVRRAITDLTNEGKLIKTKYRVMGNYGKKVYTWRVA
jgi:hypothetical protein